MLSLIKLGKEELASRGSDNSIRIWNWMECNIVEISGCENGVSCLVKINERLLASGSNDCGIVIWN